MEQNDLNTRGCKIQNDHNMVPFRHLRVTEVVLNIKSLLWLQFLDFFFLLLDEVHFNPNLSTKFDCVITYCKNMNDRKWSNLYIDCIISLVHDTSKRTSLIYHAYNPSQDGSRIITMRKKLMNHYKNNCKQVHARFQTHSLTQIVIHLS